MNFNIFIKLSLLELDQRINPVIPNNIDFILHSSSGLHVTDSSWQFLMNDWNRDGQQDLVAVNRSGGTNTTEIHVLNGSDNYKTFLLHASTGLHVTDANWEFLMVDWNRDGRQDLVAVNRRGGYNTTEVHIITGKYNYYQPAFFMKSLKISEEITKSYQDNDISKNDYRKLFNLCAEDGIVDSSEFSDLKYIVSNFTSKPDVKFLSSCIIDGQIANIKFSRYYNKVLGNLRSGSSSLQLNLLVDKWFFGNDVPFIGPQIIAKPSNTSIAKYTKFEGKLFGKDGPLFSDIIQGNVGDCYFLASLGSVVNRSKGLITDMITDNFDGTFTVKFFIAPNKNAFITVNKMLPAKTFSPIFAQIKYDFSLKTNILWVALVEKAYAQLNETGLIGRDGSNSYFQKYNRLREMEGGINGGMPADATFHITGIKSTSIGINRHTSDQKLSQVIDIILNETANGKFCTYVTRGDSDKFTSNGLVLNHAYVILGYNRQTDKVKLYNPHGYEIDVSSRILAIEGYGSYITSNLYNSPPLYIIK